MTICPVSLPPLDGGHINELERRARDHEPVFRNVLIDRFPDEADFLTNAELEGIFGRYVRVSGQATRVSDFRVGPFASEGIFDFRFPSLDPSKLGKDEVLILIERLNDARLQLYRVSPDSSVIRNGGESYHQF